MHSIRSRSRQDIPSVTAILLHQLRRLKSKLGTESRSEEREYTVYATR